MPSSGAHACAVPGCATHAVLGRARCAAHTSTPARTPSPADRIYSSPRWVALAKAVIREEPTCHWCTTRPSTVADHVVELRDGGAAYDRANLVGACNACNVSKGQRAAQRRRAAQR